MKRAGRVCSVGLVRCAPEAWSRFVCGPLRGPCRFGSALRLWAARPRLWFVRASRRRPLCSRACVVKKEAEASRGSWSVVSVVAPVLRAPASPSARARRVLGRVACGGPRRFFPEALAPGKARASGLFRNARGRCHGPCFSALANPRLGFVAPGSFGESRARQSAVQPGWGVGMRGRNQLSEEWRGRGGVNRLGPGAGSVSARRRSRNGFRHCQPLIPVETGHRFRLELARLVKSR